MRQVSNYVSGENRRDNQNFQKPSSIDSGWAFFFPGYRREFLSYLKTKIIDAYRDHPQCVNEDKLLPVMSNQKMNEYLKEIADRCEINKKMTFHTARHTFATTVTLTNGVPIETVSKMLGHKTLRTTQQYAKILDQKVSEDMKKLKTILNSKL